MSEGRRLAGQTLIRAFSFVLSGSISFLLLPIYTRFLATSEYGALDVVLSLNRALIILASLGMGSGIGLALQEVSSGERPRRVSSALAAQAIWLLLLMLALGAAAPLLTQWLFGASERTAAIRLGLLLLATQVLLNFTIGIANWMREAWRFLLVATGGAVAAGAGSAIGVAILHRGVAGALSGLLIGTALFLPVGFALVGRHFAPQVSWRDVRRCFALGLPFAFGDSAELLFPFAIRLVLLAAGGLDWVGIFAAANTVCLVITTANYAFTGAWLPFVMSADGKRHRQEWPRVLALYGLGLIGIAAVLTLLAPPVVAFVLGGGVYQRATPLFAPIALAYWLKAMRQASGGPIIAQGESWAYSVFGALAIAGSVSLAFLLTDRFGLAGAAWGIAGGEAIGLTAQSIFAARRGAGVLVARSVLVMAGGFVALTLATEIAAPSTAGEIAFRLLDAILFLGVLLAGRAVALGDLRHAALLLRSLLPGR